MNKLDYTTRREHLDWCIKYIDHECIWRVDENHPSLVGKAGGTYSWQFYSRRASFNAEFSRRIGLLFWDTMADVHAAEPFQICACLPSGVPIGMSLLSAAEGLGIEVNLFFARREAKTYGTFNWFEGTILPEVPVLIVDDISASANFMLLASARVKLMLKLPLHRHYFTLIQKIGSEISKQAMHTENMLKEDLMHFFTLDDFALTSEAYARKYGQPPIWTGIVK